MVSSGASAGRPGPATRDHDSSLGRRAPGSAGRPAGSSAVTTRETGRREPVPPPDSDAGQKRPASCSAGAPTAATAPRRLTPGLASQARSVGSCPPRRVVRVPGRARAGGDRKREEAVRRHFPVRACRASPSALRLRPGRAPGSAGLGPGLAAARRRAGPPARPGDAERGRLAAGRAEREGAECVYKIPRRSCRRD